MSSWVGEHAPEGERYVCLERLRRTKRSELLAGLCDLRSSIESVEPADADGADAASESWSGAEIRATTIEITAHTLRCIEHALERLRRGGYGVCIECGTEIAAARLRALPFADRCRPCQERADETTAAAS